ncbi:Uncharacterised protein [Staphylococcus aureus]|nr:Uncharacterised protein [Staphylococcus aureus]CAI3007633.1 hypothetical protein KFFOFENI_KFFOFENI_00491 [Staphylococcus aureus]CAI3009863.1 hypothetical protein OMDLDMCL_OMDLDMCL_00700 [Staphylococcus aureus]CAI3043328.1 hypothetical protein ANIIDONK_ANIIDONK_00882 [Staphylococcus aureus]SAZ31698.1 Uncharacterised protein [Staphylococcus aureus]
MFLSASTTVKVVVEVIKLLTFLESVDDGCTAAIRILVFKRLGAVLFGIITSEPFALSVLSLFSPTFLTSSLLIFKSSLLTLIGAADIVAFEVVLSVFNCCELTVVVT